MWPAKLSSLQHLAYEHATRGACLALCARRHKSLGQVADTACQYGSPKVVAIPADVSNVDDCKRLVEETVNHFGRLDHLVNNAGISTGAMFEEATDITNFRPIMETNFWGPVYTTHFALPYLRRSKGKIVVMSSPEAWLPTPRTAVYSASKLGLEIFYDSLGGTYT
ncbi:hypothetical protein L6164_010921 [Bauhinia variegata]|uniref:Uncharacterized protein n=1 Tax=Bauhinia variegata TaxID=167791 RepID=A0ACB9P401_BAUVA|nr:hypothetical protein L6164_010921 [Bauhinia variegata]